MIGALKRRYETFRGTGQASLAIPALDGAFRPNRAIEDADLTLTVEAPDNLVQAAGTLWFSSGARLCVLNAAGEYDVAETCSSEITAMAGDGGSLAIATEGGAIRLRMSGQPEKEFRMKGEGDVTALCLAPQGGLIACIGSRTVPAREWSRDLLGGGSSGSVWRLDSANGQSTCLADHLAYPAGVHFGRDGSILVAESWKHRLLRLRPGHAPEIALSNLPGYPSRIIANSIGGYWLSVPAPLNQLVEFVLREDVFRRRMIAEVDPKYWIAPALTPPDSFLQPMQQGAQRVLGTIKPWAPGMSYGLLVELDENVQPIRSYHSRADGSRHGITSAAEHAGKVFISSKGSDTLLSMPIEIGVAP